MKRYIALIMAGALLIAGCGKKEEQLSSEAVAEVQVTEVHTESVTEPLTEVPTDPETEVPTDPETEPVTEEETFADFTEDTYVEYHFRSKKQLEQHFEKHGGEFGSEFGYKTAQDYEAGASDVINDPSALFKYEAEDGDEVYYIEATNEFVILSTDGYIRTYFRPSAGKKYFDRQ